ncbi:MAG TPA: lipid-A-disaccharide synthase N-terminal domain-containing protein [Xanthobacteraceae bacterium]|nr:lipid-A-disaccharide synthase N-terminal domain-containing protein [Xanthobacteraceae bacterium]
MLVSLSQSVGDYLQNVFFLELNWGLLLGYAGQSLFGMRFIVQWLASERVGRSVMPVAFWFFSIGGGVLLLAYALYKRDPVFIIGQGLGLFVYLRNLYFVFRERKMALVS